MTSVSEDQFDVEGDRVVHRPTSAAFYWINWGSSGADFPNGDNFDRAAILRVAKKLLAERPSLKKRTRLALPR
jgi:hypothetical protein